MKEDYARRAVDLYGKLRGLEAKIVHTKSRSDNPKIEVSVWGTTPGHQGSRDVFAVATSECSGTIEHVVMRNTETAKKIIVLLIENFEAEADSIRAELRGLGFEP